MKIHTHFDKQCCIISIKFIFRLSHYVTCNLNRIDGNKSLNVENKFTVWLVLAMVHFIDFSWYQSALP